MSKTVKLGDIATFVNGYPFKPTDWKKEGLPIIRIQDLTGNAYETNYFNGTVPAKYYIHNGDILISWSASLGIYEWQRGNAVLNQHIFKVVFNKLPIDKQYFRHIVGHKLNVMVALTHGATMKHITKGDFDNIPIPLPPLAEQHRIAALLDKADALRQKDRQLLSHYDQLTQAIFLDMFGDPVRNEKGWKVDKLSKGAKLQGGFAFKSSDYSNYGTKLVKITNVHFEKLIWDDIDFIPENIAKAYPNFMLKSGDILMAMTRPIIKSLSSAKVVKVEHKDLPCILNQRVGRFIIDKTKLNTSFLLQLCFSEYFKNRVEECCAVALQPNISSKQIEDFLIYYPPLLLQQRFAEMAIQIEQQKLIAQQQMMNSENLFQRLLQESFGE
ncbi:restriction endonuclease subunit S [Nibrella saemangeumensis]|uniref:Restriction endonuclease subunit S n=1 Tax=Nibrella saemangeumensis TaxID=1084526 RepID=A0ABP8NBB6_9BACT